MTKADPKRKQSAVDIAGPSAKRETRYLVPLLNGRRNQTADHLISRLMETQPSCVGHHIGTARLVASRESRNTSFAPEIDDEIVQCMNTGCMLYKVILFPMMLLPVALHAQPCETVSRNLLRRPYRSGSRRLWRLAASQPLEARRRSKTCRPSVA
jgi:hypothetical protein